MAVATPPVARVARATPPASTTKTRLPVAASTKRPSGDRELPKHGLMLIAAGGSLAVAGVLALISDGSMWMAAFGVLVALIGVASLMAMMAWLMSSSNADDS